MQYYGSNRWNGYESKLALRLTTGHGMSALHVSQAVRLSGVSSQATFWLEDAKNFTFFKMMQTVNWSKKVYIFI